MTSYSDPFYDRLDAVARGVRRQWLLVVVVLIVAIAGSAWLVVSLGERPVARDAGRLLAAQGDAKALAELAGDAQAAPALRAHAGIEAVQLHLLRGETAAARPLAERALADAEASKDLRRIGAAGLTLAAVKEQAGDAAGAERDYRRLAGELRQAARDLYLTAILGQARTLEASGRSGEAIALLATRVDDTMASGSEGSMQVLITEYWRLRRAAATAAPAPVAPPVAPAPSATAVR